MSFGEAVHKQNNTITSMRKGKREEKEENNVDTGQVHHDSH